MKKIIAFSVLLALLSAAVFAQDGSGWKVGFRAQLVRDFFYTTKASGEGEQKTTVSPDPTGTLSSTTKYKLGEYIKGSSNLWTFTNREGFDNRIILSLDNNGDHHSVHIDAKVDNDWISGPSLMGLINGGAADWWFKGDTGAAEGALVVFDGAVGNAGYGGFVPVYEIWDDWTGHGEYNFFGVVRADGFVASNSMRVIDMVPDAPWGSYYALGATFAGNYKLAIGSTLGWPGDGFNTGSDNPIASTSKAKAGFMLSAQNLGPLAVDLFYAINGGDTNTVLRGTGSWNNLIGLYANIDLGKIGVNGLGISVGYTANFKADEVREVDVADYAHGATAPVYKPVNITNPLWSGIDINVNFGGIEKLGIGLNNNLSFAGTKVENRAKDEDDIIVGLTGATGPIIPAGVAASYNFNENWFAYKASLNVSYALSDRLSVGLTLRNILTVYDGDYKTTAGTTTTTAKGKETEDSLITSLHAKYSVGNVTVGMGLSFGVDGITTETENKTSVPGSTTTTTGKGTENVVRFGIPLFFKVAF